MRGIIPKEYRQKVIAAIIVIAAGVAILLLAQKLGYIIDFIGRFIKILSPVLVGGAISYLLSPLLRRFDKIFSKLFGRKKPHPRLSRIFSVIVCYILFLGSVGAFLTFVVPRVFESFKAMLGILTSFIEQNAGKLNEYLLKYEIITVEGEDFTFEWAKMIDSLGSYASQFFTNALAITETIYSLVLNTLVALAVSIYSMFEKERFAGQLKKIMYAFLPREICASGIYWMRRSSVIFAGFVTGKIIDSAIMGVLCYLCMRIFGMEFPELISVIVGISNVVPFFGPIFGGIIGVALLLIINPTNAIWFALLILVLQQLDGNVIGPHILGGTIGLSAFWIMIAILVGGGLFGFPGMLLGAPIFAIIYSIVRVLLEFRLNKRGLPRESAKYVHAPESLDAVAENQPEPPRADKGADAKPDAHT